MATSKIKKLLLIWLGLSGSGCLGADASHIIDNYKQETSGFMSWLADLQKNSSALAQSIESFPKILDMGSESRDVMIDAIFKLHLEWEKVISKQIETLGQLIGNLQQQISTLVAYNDAREEASFAKPQVDWY